MDAEVYQKMRSLEERHWWFSARRRYIEQLIQRCVQPDQAARFCEIGAGTGGNLELLGRYAKTDAVESDADALVVIKQRDLSNVNQVSHGCLPDQLPFSDRYDAVFALDVIEHVEDDVSALTRIADLLDDDGRLVLTVPAYQWLWSGHDVANQHFRRYTRQQIISRIEQAGLQVSFSSYFNTLLFPLKLVQHLKDKTLPPKTNEWQVSMPPAWLNTLFAAVFNMERHLAGRLSMPFGLSVAVVAHRAND